MNAKLNTLGILAIIGACFLAVYAAAGENVLISETDKASYGFGVSVVRNLKQQGGSFNIDMMIQGMKDELTGEKLLLTEDDLVKTLAAMRQETKKSRTCRTIEYPDQHQETICSDDSRKSEPAPAQEHIAEAIAFATIKKDGPELPAGVQALLDQSSPPEHTFAWLAQQQQQEFDANGNIKIVLSEAQRQLGQIWLKTQQQARQGR